MGTSRSWIWLGSDDAARIDRRPGPSVSTIAYARILSQVTVPKCRTNGLDRRSTIKSKLISAEHDSWSSARTAWIEVARILPQVSRKLPTPQVQNGRPGSTGDTVSISATHDFRGPRRTAVIDRQRSASRPSEGQESQSRPLDGSHASSSANPFSPLRLSFVTFSISTPTNPISSVLWGQKNPVPFVESASSSATRIPYSGLNFARLNRDPNPTTR